MSYIKSSNTIEKSLVKKVNDLLRENKSLRKKVGKLRKLVDKADVAVLCSSADQEEPYTEKKHSVEECPTCRGDIREFSVMGMTYQICQKCKSRKKVKTKK